MKTLLACFLSCLLSAAGHCQVVTKVPTTVTLSFAENTSTFIRNPERGLYRHLNLFEDPAGRSLLEKCSYARDRGYTIVYTQAILPNAPMLDQTTLDKVAAGFSDIRRCGVKALVRFYYFDNQCDGVPGEACVPCPKNASNVCVDPPLQTILQHIQQLKRYLAENQDLILALKAGFIGPWGEWHSSTLSTDADRGTVLRALLDALPANRMVQVRTPAKRHAIFSGTPTVDPNNAIGNATGPLPFDGSHAARTGHHNDCFLSSPDDRGTYSAPGSDAHFKERQYIAANARFTPMGGETCNLLPGYTPSDEALQQRAIDDIQTLHWSFLNGGYSETVRYKLGARDLDYDDPNSGYHIHSSAHVGKWPDILRTLGYRFVLPKVTFQRSVRRAGTMQFIADVQNVGVAALFNARPVYLVLHNQLNAYRIRLKVDPRRWSPGISRVNLAVAIPSDVLPARYSVSLWMPDEAASLRELPEHAVRFAHHDFYWDSARGYNTLSVLGIEVTP